MKRGITALARDEDKIVDGQDPNRVIAPKVQRGRTRWWIVWTLFCSTVINYISRQSFSVLSPMIAQQLHLTHASLGRILGAFQISYALTWLLGGIFLDAVGTRIGLAFAAGWWSLVNILMAFANSVGSFVAFRFLLGIGEGFNWPGASKAVAEWFPRDERSIAVAIFDSGSSIGAAVATIAIPWIALAVGWRWAFVCTGGIGLLWVAAWWTIYYPLDEHPRVTPEEVALIHAGRDIADVNRAKGLANWFSLLRSRNVWGIVLGRSLTDPIWWFYVFWLPEYLSDARGFNLSRIALFAWSPFVAADLGNFTGGIISGYFIRRGAPVLRVRKAVCIVSCIPILAGIPAAHVHSPYLALILICAALWGYASWSTMGLTLPADLFPHSIVGSITGLSGLVAGLAGALFTFAVGETVDRFSYGPAFLAAGLLPVFATIFMVLLINEPKQGEVRRP